MRDIFGQTSAVTPIGANKATSVDMRVIAASHRDVRDLIRQLQTWEKELAAPRWPGVMDYHFRIGTRVYRFPV